MVSSVQGGKIVWCLLSTVAKRCGVFCSPWQKMPGVFWVWYLLSFLPYLIYYENDYSDEKRHGFLFFISAETQVVGSR